MSYEIEIDDIEYDRGYGIEYGTLQIEITPVFTNETFTGHNGSGNLATYGDSNALTSFNIETATLFLIDQDGGECGEIELDHDQVLKLVDEDIILKQLIRTIGR